MDIKEYIPTGIENAISRQRLAEITGMSDREVRREIHIARRDIPILNLSDGNGYFIPDMNKKSEIALLKRWYKQENSRLKSIGWALTTARRTLINCGVKL